MIDNSRNINFCDSIRLTRKLWTLSVCPRAHVTVRKNVKYFMKYFKGVKLPIVAEIKGKK